MRTRPKSNDPCWCGSGSKYKRCHKASDRPIAPGRVTPRRVVPAHIGRPDYAEDGVPDAFEEEPVKDADVLARMRVAGRLAAEVLDEVGRHVAVGVTTEELDHIGHEAAIARDSYPSPLNYRGYPKSLCTSINEVICHGIPDDRRLENGDILNIDVTVFHDGVHGDNSRMFLVGEVDEQSRRLVEVTSECLERGIAAVKPGRPVSDIGEVIEAHAREHGFGVVRAFVGHGVGRRFHGDPMIPHYPAEHADTVMQTGMTFTIEPMLTTGTWQHRMWEDDWTAVTADGGRSAQFEHTLVVTDDGAEILTVTGCP